MDMRQSLAFGFAPAPGSPPVEWRVSDQLVPYETAVTAMNAHSARISEGAAGELVWLLEHPPIYTAGTGAQRGDVLEARLPVFETGRGGRMTYHGPGQRVAYLMLDLRKRGQDVRRYVATLEEWLIRSLSRFNVRAERREDRIGVWVRRPDKGESCEDKIAAVGIRIKRWVTLHGVALNVDPELAHFTGIIACGVHERHYGVTSLADLGHRASLPEVDIALRREFETLFGATTDQIVGSSENISPGRRMASASSSLSR